MSDYPASLVSFAPAANAPSLSALAESLGHGPDNFSVPLAPTSAEPATHYGFHAAAGPAFVALLTGNPADHLDLWGDLPLDQVIALQASMHVSVELKETINGRPHFERELAKVGLVRVDPSATP